jgi:sugar lactone lactonase YvrE
MKYALLVICCCVVLTTQGQSGRITFAAPKLYPEGIAFDNKNQIAYVGSVRTGTIGKVDKNGVYKEVYANKGLKSTYGMKVDEKRNWLWVCSGDANYSKYKDPSTFKKMARVIAIDLSNNQKVRDIDLSQLMEGNHFLNDLTLDDKGNLYVTDSFSPAIYKIDSKGTPTLFATNELFKAKSIGLNGIVYHPKGYLLVAHNTDGVILKVDVRDPSKVERVKIDQHFPGADGMWLDEKQNLVLVQNKGVNRVFKFSSADQWLTAQVIAKSKADEPLQYPTTCGMFNQNINVLDARLNELSDSTYKPSDKFSFHAVAFQ